MPLLQVLAADPCAQECLAALLQPHFAKIVEQDPEALPPLRLGQCISQQNDEPKLLEPLPALVAAVRRLAQLQRGGGLPGSEDSTVGLVGMGEEGTECATALQVRCTGCSGGLSPLEGSVHGVVLGFGLPGVRGGAA